MTVHMGIKGCFIGRYEYTRTLEIRCYKVSKVILQSWLRPAIETPALRWGFGVGMDCRKIHRVGHGAYKANDCRHRHPLRTSGEFIASTQAFRRSTKLTKPTSKHLIWISFTAQPRMDFKMGTRSSQSTPGTVAS